MLRLARKIVERPVLVRAEQSIASAIAKDFGVVRILVPERYDPRPIPHFHLLAVSYVQSVFAAG